MNLLEGRLDLTLHLLDRQVVAEDGRLVCKVDDVEVVEEADGTLVVTALLTGMPALVRRMGGRSGRGLQKAWAHLSPARADSDVPYRIDLELVDCLDSAVHLTVGPDDVLVRQPSEPPEDGTTRHRLNDLLGARVQAPDGSDRGQRVTDARAEPRDGRLLITQLVIGKDRPGGLLGYDRKQQGPTLIRGIVRALHRDSGIVGLTQVRDLDWEDGVVRVEGEPDELSSALAASSDE